MATEQQQVPAEQAQSEANGNNTEQQQAPSQQVQSETSGNNTEQQQIPAQQVQSETNGNNILQTTVQLVQRYWVRVTAQMREHGPPVSTSFAGNLPYVLVMQDGEHWLVLSTGLTGMSNGRASFGIPGAGRYRAYAKEPTRTFQTGAAFEIPFHQLPNGQDSTREVQPWFDMEVTATGSPQTFQVRQALPNTLGRPANLYPPASAAPHPLTQAHTSASTPLDFGNYLITNQLWSDISRCYGTSHSVVTASANRAALEMIYGEQLIVVGQHGRRLQIDDRTIEFQEGATEGGRQTFGFADNTNMTASECIRKAYPKVFDWWLQSMTTLRLSSATVSSTWRPHTGSTRHRYSLALDLVYLTGLVDISPTQTASTTVWLNRLQPISNPANTAPPANADESHKRLLSTAFHKHLAEDKAASHLGWLGGPWALKRSEVGLSGNTAFIVTNNTHKNHVHVSVGIEQS
ncbi:hypothetical protein [Ralstonia sp. 24A2]|uniref:hypothetical protein n=1 Tax=Ralstonia sp. 24A2 TaxID=3447364 RepID=UPI003F6994B9